MRNQASFVADEVFAYGFSRPDAVDDVLLLSTKMLHPSSGRRGAFLSRNQTRCCHRNSLFAEPDRPESTTLPAGLLVTGSPGENVDFHDARGGHHQFRCTHNLAGEALSTAHDAAIREERNMFANVGLFGGVFFGSPCGFSNYRSDSCSPARGIRRPYPSGQSADD